MSLLFDKEPEGPKLGIFSTPYGRVRVYGTGKFDVQSTPDALVINGHQLTPVEMLRGWYVTDT